MLPLMKNKLPLILLLRYLLPAILLQDALIVSINQFCLIPFLDYATKEM